MLSQQHWPKQHSPVSPLTSRNEEGVAHGPLHRALRAARQQLGYASDTVAHNRRPGALQRRDAGSVFRLNVMQSGKAGGQEDRSPATQEATGSAHQLGVRTLLEVLRVMPAADTCRIPIQANTPGLNQSAADPCCRPAGQHTWAESEPTSSLSNSATARTPVSSAVGLLAGA